MPQSMKAYTGGQFALELDQRNSVGWIASIDGGHFKSSSVDSQVGASSYVARYSGKPTYDDVTITCGAAMSPAFWDWINASLDHKPQRRSGALVAYDFNYKERSRRTFTSALISEVGFPALDAASKTSARMTVKFSPEHIEHKEGDGSSMPKQNSNGEEDKSKRWQSCNFNFSLERFRGDDSLRNCKVEAFTVKQNVILDHIGAEQEARKIAGRLELPQLIVTFPHSMAAPWFDWYDKAVRKGTRSDVFTTGQIQYLGPDLKTELMRLNFDGVSLLSIETDKLEGQKENVANVKVTLNVEGMTLATGGGTV